MLELSFISDHRNFLSLKYEDVDYNNSINWTLSIHLVTLNTESYPSSTILYPASRKSGCIKGDVHCNKKKIQSYNLYKLYAINSPG